MAGLHTGQQVAAISVGVNAVLAALNLVVGARGGSLTVQASGIEFAADVAASLAVFFGFWYASRPADSRHPYGHGRAETLTGLIIGLALFLIGGAIAVHALRGLDDYHPPPAAYSLWPLVVALAVKSVLMASKMRVGRRTGSQALLADAWNDSVDVLSSAAAIVALGLTLYEPVTFRAADHVGGMLVGIFVIVAGLGVVRSTSLDSHRHHAARAAARACQARRVCRRGCPRGGEAVRPKDRAPVPRGPPSRGRRLDLRG